VLACGLFFNIFVGELLLFVVATIITSNVRLGPVNPLVGRRGRSVLFCSSSISSSERCRHSSSPPVLVYLSLATAEEH